LEEKMKRLLMVCIPTYKRERSLRQCIESVAAQIENASLSGQVGIYVANDASPDNTANLLRDYSQRYFAAVTREHNLGMSANIRCMLEEASRTSEYQLIITDDDSLQPGVLMELVEFLRMHRPDLPAAWTPRYSYTEQGGLHCVVCDSLPDSVAIEPSSANAARYMDNGFVLSGLILRGEAIDFEFWKEFDDNAYFPVIVFGDLLRGKGAYFWKKNIVHHTVLNVCHWESWGKNDVAIELRLFLDFVLAYQIMAQKTGTSCSFYYRAFPGIYRSVIELLRSNKLKADRSLVLDAIRDLAEKRARRLGLPARQTLILALVAGVALAAAKTLAASALSLVSTGATKSKNRDRIRAYSDLLSSAPLVFKLITSSGRP
jgi:glycosyltransferase involved in cell wall biosynthesis